MQVLLIFSKHIHIFSNQRTHQFDNDYLLEMNVVYQ